MTDLPPSSLPASFPSASPPSANLPTTVTNALNGGSNESFSFNITEPRPEGEPCGLGFLCDEERMASCRSIQYRAIAYGFGDVHAGMTCPENATTYQNCPAGSYCPSPEEVLPCPEGMFCPHKTSIPKIQCSGCPEEVVEFYRAGYGYAVVVILFFFPLIFILVRVIKRHNKDRLAHFMELASRRVNSMRAKSIRGKRQEQLKKIKPQLDLIAGRLKALANEHDQLESKGSAGEVEVSNSIVRKSPKESVRVHSDGAITFDASLLFDELDTSRDGILSYTELNQILELDTVQLTEFVHRMNEREGLSPNCRVVSRRTFVRHFVNVLAESSHFRPSKEEAEDLFNEIAEQGTNRYGAVEPEKFYTSSLSTFLSDTQINNLLVRLRGNQAGQQPSSQLRQRSLVRVLSERNADGGRDNTRAIRRDTFTAHYPRLLIEIAIDPDALPMLSTRLGGGIGSVDLDMGVDITFEDLSLTVAVGDFSVDVVDKVTGRLRAGTMTALMGGSGAGKSSLLNALCGRAFYGETTGIVKVNGRDSLIEDHRDAVGFVPQDDIMYAELTVRENFVYSGKFQLPKGTSSDDIEDLADATLASLGLSRVANSIVGDVHRRGISGGEKKRVNIGLELMSRPRALFLDEPTSGLDSSSALLVMKSLRALVENQGVTVCCVIHQPRKIIFDLFDDLVLLGVGGKVVYNGETSGARSYIERLNYRLPPGDSVADWLIDVSSGRTEPITDAEAENEENTGTPIPSREVNSYLNDDFVHSEGPSSNKVEQEFEEAKMRREMLYTSWSVHFDDLAEEQRVRYNAPEPYALPESVIRLSFFKQLMAQLSRNVLVSRRNAVSKLVDTGLIVGAVILISAFEGVVAVTVHDEPDISFDALVSDNPGELAKELPVLFAFALRSSTRILEYALKTGVITAVLVGLTAAKAITEKRLEFFRESASGYNINAYFAAINITSGIEHSLQILLAASAAFWLRNSLAHWGSYCINFLMMAWLCVSWALFLPLLVPPKNVVLVVGFFMAFFGLLFSGGLSPVKYADIYKDNSVLALFVGFVSPTRYFIEGLTVAEFRCLPEQSGFTQTAIAANFPQELNSFALLSLAQNDSNVREQSCSGWYWGALPAVLAGLTIRWAAAGAIHVSERSKQAKKPLWKQIKQQTAQKGLSIFKSTGMVVVVFVVVLAALFSVASWSILRSTGTSFAIDARNQTNAAIVSPPTTSTLVSPAPTPTPTPLARTAATTTPTSTGPTGVPTAPVADPVRVVGGPFAGPVFTNYGRSVDISSNTMAVGAAGSEFGQTFLYQLTADGWEELSPLTGVQVNGSFGSDVAVTGDEVLIGASGVWANQTKVQVGVAYYYQRQIDNTFSQVGSTLRGDEDFFAPLEAFGSSVAASANRRVVVGAPGSNVGGAAQVGRVYPFEFDVDTQDWVRMQDTPIAGGQNDNLGVAVDISNDGSKFVVGAPSNDAGYVEVFVWNDSLSPPEWESVFFRAGSQSFEGFGSGVSMIADNGSLFAVGGPSYMGGQGVIRVYEEDSLGKYSQVGPDIVGEAGEALGVRNTFSGDGMTVIAGTANGIAKRFDYDPLLDEWVQLYDPIDTGFAAVAGVAATDAGNTFVAVGSSQATIFEFS